MRPGNIYVSESGREYILVWVSPAESMISDEPVRAFRGIDLPSVLQARPWFTVPLCVILVAWHWLKRGVTRLFWELVYQPSEWKHRR